MGKEEQESAGDEEEVFSEALHAAVPPAYRTLRAMGLSEDDAADVLQDASILLSVFFRDGDDVYRTYSTTARGVDRLLFVNNILDLVPYGRQEDWEDSPPGWPQFPAHG
ncbi:MAG: DUF899 family protein [Candidatus Dormiibacterota bacterium]